MTQDAATTPFDDATPGAGGSANPDGGPLDGLDALPLAEHVVRFEAVHEELRERLAGGDA